MRLTVVQLHGPLKELYPGRERKSLQKLIIGKKSYRGG